MTRSYPLHFTGETAVVTGAAGGIGAAIAALLLHAGLRVVCLDRVLPTVAEGFEDCNACHVVDVTSPDSVADGLDQTLGDGNVSYLVNCAGILDDIGFRGATPEVWRRTLDVNLIGAHVMIQAVAGRIPPDGAASIVNVSSIEASRIVALNNPDPNPHYAASKAGLDALTRASARYLAPSRVRVNSVAPGFVATAMAVGDDGRESLPDVIVPRVPARRFARPEEIAHPIAFLLSDEAAFITGTSLTIDGGFCLT